jgi:hypothetical protein
MDTRERLQGYVKADLREVINEKTSLMPDFKADRLSDKDLNDVLSYLGTLRGGSDVRVRTTEEGVTSRDLLDGLKIPTRWTMYSGDYTGKRHSPLTRSLRRT